MKGHMLWSQLPSNRKHIGLEKQQKTLLIMRFMLPNFRIMQKKDCSFRIYQNIKITHADSDHPFLAITQNWAMRLFVGFVMQGHMEVPNILYWLRAKRALMLFDNILRTRTVLLPYTLHSDGILLIFNGTSLDGVYALLALNWRLKANI